METAGPGRSRASGGWRRGRLVLVAGALAAIAVASVALVARIAATSGPAGRLGQGEPALEDLDVYGRVPPFSLTERSGRPVAREDLAGVVWVANFIYTKCTESCPTQSLHVAGLQADFAGAPDLRLVSITVDPRHDTPEVLRAHADRYGADAERWLFLTGDKRVIYCLARGLRLSVVDPAGPSPPACDGAAAGGRGARLASLLGPRPAFATHGSDGLVMHSARLVLVDRGGRIRAYHLATDGGSMARLRPNVETVLAER